VISPKDRLTAMIRALLRRLVLPPLFQVMRHFQDQVFLSELRNPRLPASIFAPFLYFPVRLWRLLGRIARRSFDDYALAKYSDYIRRHYGPDGRGYFDYIGMRNEEKAALFGVPRGRIEPVLQSYGSLFGLADGDSFFDVGCGRGQNIIVLMDHFPNSPIHGADISAEAVDVVRQAVDDPRVTTEARDLSAEDAYDSIPDGAYDHVVMSHVLALIFGENIDATRAIRHKLIKNLVRISRKSVIILDNPAIVSGEDRFVIEQLNRGYYSESITRYFPADGGMVINVPSGDSVAVVFLHSDEAAGRAPR